MKRLPETFLNDIEAGCVPVRSALSGDWIRKTLFYRSRGARDWNSQFSRIGIVSCPTRAHDWRSDGAESAGLDCPCSRTAQ